MRAAPGAACVQRDVRPARAGNAGHVRGWRLAALPLVPCAGPHSALPLAIQLRLALEVLEHNGKLLAWAAVRTGVALPLALRSGVCILTFIIIFFLSTSSYLP